MIATNSLRIAVADDELSRQQYFQEVLPELGHEVVAVAGVTAYRTAFGEAAACSGCRTAIWPEPSFGLSGIVVTPETRFPTMAATVDGLG